MLQGPFPLSHFVTWERDGHVHPSLEVFTLRRPSASGGTVSQVGEQTDEEGSEAGRARPLAAFLRAAAAAIDEGSTASNAVGGSGGAAAGGVAAGGVAASAVVAGSAVDTTPAQRMARRLARYGEGGGLTYVDAEGTAQGPFPLAHFHSWLQASVDHFLPPRLS